MLKFYCIEADTVDELESALLRMGVSKAKPEIAILKAETEPKAADTRLEDVASKPQPTPEPVAESKPPAQKRGGKGKPKRGGGGFRKNAPKTYHDLSKLEGIALYHKADGSQKVVGIIGTSEGKGGNAGHELLWLGNIERKDGEIVCWTFQNGDPWTHNNTRFPDALTDRCAYDAETCELLVEMCG